MSTDVAIRPVESPGALALRSDQTDWTPAQKAALNQIGIAEAPIGDQQVFMHVAQRSGLDPFARQIYMISRWDFQSGRNKWTIQTGIEGYRVIADRRKEYAGQLEPQWCGEDEVWRDVWTSTKPPVAARVGVIRRDWPNPAWGVVHFDEFAATKKGGGFTHMWETKGRNQIAKCAEAAALRRAFPQDFTGVFIDEEMEHLNNSPPRTVIDAEQERQAEPNWDELIETQEVARDLDELRKTWYLAKGVRPNDAELRERIAQAMERVNGVGSVIDAQVESTEPMPDDEPRPDNFDRGNETRRMWAQLAKGGIDPKDRERRLHIVTRILTRPTPLGSFNDLTDTEIAQAVAFMARCEDNGTLAETLAAMAPVTATATEAPPVDPEPATRKGKGRMSVQEIDMARNELVAAADVAALSEVWNEYSKRFTMPTELRAVFASQRERLQQVASAPVGDFDTLWQQVIERAPEEWSDQQLNDDFWRITGKAPNDADAADVQRYLDAMAGGGKA